VEKEKKVAEVEERGPVVDASAVADKGTSAIVIACDCCYDRRVHHGDKEEEKEEEETQERREEGAAGPLSRDHRSDHR